MCLNSNFFAQQHFFQVTHHIHAENDDGQTVAETENKNDYPLR
jgi:hypothetical protein